MVKVKSSSIAKSCSICSKRVNKNTFKYFYREFETKTSECIPICKKCGKIIDYAGLDTLKSLYNAISQINSSNFQKRKILKQLRLAYGITIPISLDFLTKVYKKFFNTRILSLIEPIKKVKREKRKKQRKRHS